MPDYKLFYEMHFIITATNQKVESNLTKAPPFNGILTEQMPRIKGVLNFQLPQQATSTSNALYHWSFEKAMLEQIYIIPNQIDAGLFQQTIYKTFKIWNAYLYENQTCIEVKKHNLPDVFLETDPYITFTPFYYKTFTLKFPGQGVPFIKGYFEFNFGIDITKIDISGLRIAVPNFYCYTPEEIIYGFSFSTVTTMNFLQKEQRRPIHDKYIKTLNLKITIPSNLMQALLQYFDFITGRVAAIPILYEPLTFRGAENLQGRSFFYVNEDISEYEELIYNTEALVFYSMKNTEIQMIEGIDIQNRLITLKDTVKNSFPRIGTIIFPAFFGILNNVEVVLIRGDIFECNLEIKEYFK